MYDAFVEVSRDETVKEMLKEKIICFWRYLKNDLIVHNEYMYTVLHDGTKYDCIDDDDGNVDCSVFCGDVDANDHNQ
jgi:hypothetical protein